MKNQELFDRTIGILVKAYQNDTLFHGTGCACAIGNLIAHGMGYKFTGNIFEINSIDWDSDADYDWLTVHKFGKMLNYPTQAGIKQLESTGYTIKQTCCIEDAFESVDKKDYDGYLGLISIVDALMEIHEATSEEANSAKQLFVKELAV